MLLIGLDMDGVINSDSLIRKWYENKQNELKEYFKDPYNLKKEAKRIFSEEFNHYQELVFPELAQIITNICEQTDAKILWTSSWRRLNIYKNIDDAKAMFNRRGLPGDRLIGYTPSLKYNSVTYTNYTRGDEIRAWILNNDFENIEKCAVIDDLDEAGKGLPKNAHFFQTSEEYGITEKIANEILNYLKK